MKDIDKDKIHNYKIPENYFENLEKDVLNKTVEASSGASIVKLMRPWMAVAASVALLAVIFFGWHDISLEGSVAEYENGQNDYLAEVEDELFTALDIEGLDDDETLSDLADFLVELQDFEN